MAHPILRRGAERRIGHDASVAAGHELPGAIPRNRTMARIENPTVRMPPSLGQPAPCREAARLAARAGTFTAGALVSVAIAIAGTVVVAFGLLLATVAAPLFAAVVAVAVVRGRRARGLPLQAA